MLFESNSVIRPPLALNDELFSETEPAWLLYEKLNTPAFEVMLLFVSDTPPLPLETNDMPPKDVTFAIGMLPTGGAPVSTPVVIEAPVKLTVEASPVVTSEVNPLAVMLD